MADLTDRELISMMTARHGEVFPYEVISMVYELIRHRATMKRLHEWIDLELCGDSAIMGGHVTIGDRQIDSNITRFIAGKLREICKPI